MFEWSDERNTITDSTAALRRTVAPTRLTQARADFSSSLELNASDDVRRGRDDEEEEEDDDVDDDDDEEDDEDE